jgi:uncharacterized integral membrane protein (TIGR00698 family)
MIAGLIFAATLAALAMLSARLGWVQHNGFSALTIAIVLGLVAGNSFYPRIAPGVARGVTFSKQFLLRLGIILYGWRLTFQDIGHVGIVGVLIDSIIVCTTFALAWWLGTRVFGLDRRTAMLIGAGSSICGAAAVMAVEPVVHGRTEQVAVAVATVVVFGTLAMFLYPFLYHLNVRYGLLTLSPGAYGLFTGSTIHEVAQVVAAGRAISEQAANTAVIAKMVRVMMLAPFLMALSAYLSRGNTDTQRVRRMAIPWFAVGFIAVAALNSLAWVPKPLVAVLIDCDTAILAMAMAALGLSTHISAIRTAGLKPLALAAVLFVWLVAGGMAINLAAARFATSDVVPVGAQHAGNLCKFCSNKS